MATIDLKGLDKATVLAALYNASRSQGMGFVKFNPTPMSVEEARVILAQTTSFDYLRGRVLKIDLSTDELDPWLYDRDNGQNAAQQAIDSLRGTNDPNSVVIRAQHASATRASAQFALEHLSDEIEFSEQEVTLGLSDVADMLKPKIEEALRSTKSPLE